MRKKSKYEQAEESSFVVIVYIMPQQLLNIIEKKPDH